MTEQAFIAGIHTGLGNRGKLKIYVNGRFLLQVQTGVQRFAAQLLAAIDRRLAAGVSDFERVKVAVLAPRGSKRTMGWEQITAQEVGLLKGHLWDQLELPYYSRDGILVGLCGSGPLCHRHQIVVIHDAAIFSNPQNFSASYRLAYSFLAPRIMRTARAIVTVSEFSRRELVGYLPELDSKLFVVPNGAEHILCHSPDVSVLAAHGLDPGGYVFALGTVSPNKNFGLIAEAFARLQHSGLRLVVVGGQATSVLSRIQWTTSVPLTTLGYVSDAAIRALYENALCFVFASFYEGFGIPPLEAMLCRCPVIVSDIPALRETCADAALYCDPHDPERLATLISELANNAQSRARLRDLGLVRARQFTWDNSAEKFLTILRALLPACGKHGCIRVC